jgi:hypothetical protein
MILGLACWAQEPMNNESILKLVKSGMSEELILSFIRQQPGNYTLTADELVMMKSNGVSERVIQEMLAKRSGVLPASTPGGGSTAKSATSVKEPGLYYKKGNDWLELLTEQVAWKTKGSFQNLASVGIVKKKLQGSVETASSRNFLSNPVEVMIHPPQGVSVNEYLLLPLKVNKGRREFEAGPTDKKTGVARGAISFGVEKIGEDQFKIVVPTALQPGEYGILPFAAIGSDSGTTSMYTFRILM